MLNAGVLAVAIFQERKLVFVGLFLVRLAALMIVIFILVFIFVLIFIVVMLRRYQALSLAALGAEVLESLENRVHGHAALNVVIIVRELPWLLASKALSVRVV